MVRRPALPTHPRLRSWSTGALALVTLLPACKDSPTSVTAGQELAQVAAAIAPATVGAHVAWLAADERLGRRTPGPGLAASADYVAGVFREAGLAPGGDDGSFLQRWPCEGVSGDDRPANVIAWRLGSDPRLASEWVVLTAHYDGLGIRQPDARGDSIYNGADDDASGTAALLEVARAFSRLRRPPARSVAFVATSGEELGLVGSWWFVAHPPAAMSDMVANVNLDMVGRNASDQLYAFGQAWSSVGAAAAATSQAHPELGFSLVGLTNEDHAFERSDHFPFADAGIPAVFLNTGNEADYHHPSDEAATIDNEKLSRVSRLTFFLVHELASRPERPSWNASWNDVRASFKPTRGTCRR